MPKVSVIVPIYNVEKYIAQCARSLFKQTLDDVEYIFIDDCTPDQSIKILEEIVKEFPHRASQIRIERMPFNSGLPNVRKYGIELAVGEYIIHCDSDDWVDEIMLEEMYKEAVKSHADIVVCDFYLVNSAESKYIKACNSIDKVNYIYDGLCCKAYMSMCNKLVKRDLYYGVEIYPSVNMGEDMVVSLQLIRVSSKISHIEKAYYYYRINELSIVRNNSIESIVNRFNQAIANVNIVEDVLSKYMSGIRFIFAMDRLKLGQRNLLQSVILNKYYYKLWKSTFPELNYRIWINPYVSLKDKVKFYLRIMRLYY